VQVSSVVSRLASASRFAGNGPIRRLGLSLAGAVLVLALTALLGAFVLERAYAGRVPPGYQAGDVPLGGLSMEEAASRLEEMFRVRYGQLTLVADGKEFPADPAELGIWLDTSATLYGTVSEVPRASFLERGIVYLRGLLVSREVPLVLVMDEEALRRYLTALANRINADAVPAKIQHNGGSWQVVPSVPGKQLRIDDAMGAIRLAVSQLARGPIPLPVETVEPVLTTTVAQELARRADAATVQPLVLRVGDRTRTISPEDLAAHITFAATPSTTLGLDHAWLSGVLASVAREVESPSKEPVIAWQGDNLVVRDPGQNGLSLDMGRSIEMVVAAVNAGIHEVTLPVKEVKPKVSADNVASLGIKELIAVGRSYFRGSAPERAHNIKVAAGYINGLLIAPGETFSFNDAIGEISTARGYQEGYTIVADRTVRGVGGGVCQVSTTVFRAAFWAGLPIVERNPHIYRVGWYEEGGDPVGLDAAIYQPGADLRFVNDTGHYILVQASAENGVLSVYFYGTKPGRTVKMDGPFISNRRPAPEDVYEVDPDLPKDTKRQVEWAKEGMDVTVYRLIYQDGQLVRKDSFFSRYTPWPNVFRVSPDRAPTVEVTPEATPTPGTTPTPTATPTR
jgi:vancomycin resistance protein YoaR